MRTLACLRTNGLLGLRSSGLSPAQALRLEDHLASCARCSEEAALLDGLRELATSAPASLRPVVREQAIRRALSQAGAVQVGGSGLERLWPAGALAAAALIAAAAAFGLVVRQGSSEVEQPRSAAGAMKPIAPAAAAASAHVLSGEVEMDGRTHTGGMALGSAHALRSATGATIVLAHATVELRAGTALRWNAQARELHLDEGSVVADVDPRAHQPFTVATPEFAVHVLGTRFEVSLEDVIVERGRVRVVAADGTVLAESLVAGERLIVPPSAFFEGDAAVEHPRAQRGRRARHAPPTGASQPDPGALLAQARAHLAARKVADARQSVEAALALTRRAPRQRAEAMSLRAECALVEGDLGTAIEAYLRVARAFGREPAGQNALFAAARLEAERGRSAAAAALFERYLARYPSGRFVKEARTRLRELGAVLDHAP